MNKRGEEEEKRLENIVYHVCVFCSSVFCIFRFLSENQKAEKPLCVVKLLNEYLNRLQALERPNTKIMKIIVGMCFFRD